MDLPTRFLSAVLGMLLAAGMQPASADSVPLQIATLEYPPYIFNVAGSPHGPVVDIVRETFSRMGQPANIRIYPIPRGLAKLDRGEVDAFFSIKDTPERRQSMQFPQEALFSQQFVFFTTRNARIRFNGNLDAIADARIGVVEKTSYGPRLDKAIGSGQLHNVQQAVDHESNFKKLLSGRVDLVPCSRLVGLSYLKKLGGEDRVTISGPEVDTTVSYLVFTRARDMRAVSDRFDQAIRSVRRDGTFRRIWGRYHLPSAQLLHPASPVQDEPHELAGGPLRPPGTDLQPAAH